MSGARSRANAADIARCAAGPRFSGFGFVLENGYGFRLDADHGTLTIARAADALTVGWITTELIDHGRCLTLTGVIAPGPVRSYVTLRSVAYQRTEADPDGAAVGFGTEVWTHVDLPLRTPPAVVRLVDDVMRSGNRHLRGELGS